MGKLLPVVTTKSVDGGKDFQHAYQIQFGRKFIPTKQKISHIKKLANCGFHTIDAGSFVSPRAMPQMADAKELFGAIESIRSETETKVLCIVASKGGARRACEFNFIDAWGIVVGVF